MTKVEEGLDVRENEQGEEEEEKVSMWESLEGKLEAFEARSSLSKAIITPNK